MGKPKAPKPPDPVVTAKAQAQANIDTARVEAALNRVNQVTPWGTSTWSRTPGAGEQMTTLPAPAAPSAPSFTPQQKDALGGFFDMGMLAQIMGKKEAASTATPGGPNSIVPNYDEGWTQTVTLPPDAQAAVEAQMRLDRLLNELGGEQFGRIREAVSQPFSYDGLPAAPEANEEARRRVEEAIFSRLNPQMDRDRMALETRLKNQGIQEGTEAWNREMGRLGESVNDARMQAVLAGGQEQSRLFALESAARERAIQERAYLRDRPINETVALLGAEQVAPPQFSAVPQVGVAPTDYQGAVYNSYAGDLNAYNQRMGARNALIGGAFGLAGAGLGGWAYGQGRGP